MSDEDDSSSVNMPPSSVSSADEVIVSPNSLKQSKKRRKRLVSKKSASKKKRRSGQIPDSPDIPIRSDKNKNNKNKNDGITIHKRWGERKNRKISQSQQPHKKSPKPKNQKIKQESKSFDEVKEILDTIIPNLVQKRYDECKLYKKKTLHKTACLRYVSAMSLYKYEYFNHCANYFDIDVSHF